MAVSEVDPSDDELVDGPSSLPANPANSDPEDPEAAKRIASAMSGVLEGGWMTYKLCGHSQEVVMIVLYIPYIPDQIEPC